MANKLKARLALLAAGAAVMTAGGAIAFPLVQQWKAPANVGVHFRVHRLISTRQRWMAAQASRPTS